MPIFKFETSSLAKSTAAEAVRLQLRAVTERDRKHGGSLQFKALKMLLKLASFGIRIVGVNTLDIAL